MFEELIRMISMEVCEGYDLEPPRRLPLRPLLQPSNSLGVAFPGFQGGPTSQRRQNGGGRFLLLILKHNPKTKQCAMLRYSKNQYRWFCYSFSPQVRIVFSPSDQHCHLWTTIAGRFGHQAPVLARMGS